MATAAAHHLFAGLLFGYIAAVPPSFPSPAHALHEPMEPCIRPCGLRRQSLDGCAETPSQRLDWAPWLLPPGRGRHPRHQHLDSSRLLWPVAGRSASMGAREAAGNWLPTGVMTQIPSSLSCARGSLVPSSCAISGRWHCRTQLLPSRRTIRCGPA